MFYLVLLSVLPDFHQFLTIQTFLNFPLTISTSLLRDPLGSSTGELSFQSNLSVLNTTRRSSTQAHGYLVTGGRIRPPYKTFQFPLTPIELLSTAGDRASQELLLPTSCTRYIITNVECLTCSLRDIK